MKKLYVSLIILLTVSFSITVNAQGFGLLKKSYEVSFPDKITKLILNPLPAGTYSVGSGGYFPTIDSAFNKLSIDGVAGEVILELIDNLYTAPTSQYGFFLNGPIPGAGPNSRVTIKPADNKNVTVEGSGLGVLYLSNTSYVTFEGVSTEGSTSLTIHTLENSIYPYNDGIVFINNSDHNVIQDIIFINEDKGPSGSGFFCPPPGGNPFAPDSNLIQNNFVKEGGITLFASGFFSTVRAKGNIIRGNRIGSENDSLITWGIQLEQCQNAIVENNIIQNLKVTTSLIGGDKVLPGINSADGLGDIIRNNIIHNLKADTGYACTGILLSGTGSGSLNTIYNNMIYDIKSTSTHPNNSLAGIMIWLQNSPKIYYNSVYLSGTSVGVNSAGSAAFYIYGGGPWGNCANVDLSNNILVNTRDESPHYASAIYVHPGSSFANSNYNDLYSNDYLVRIGSTNYNTLADWQVTGKDLNSITEMPNFIGPDLHINSDSATNIESHAIPLTLITTDFDGNLRDSTKPDIGADEFNGTILDVEGEATPLPGFSLEQNYPNPFNPATTIVFGLQTKSNVKITVLNLIGEEIAVVLDEEKEPGYYHIEFKADNLPSGVYFYQLEAGSNVQMKKMVLLK